MVLVPLGMVMCGRRNPYPPGTLAHDWREFEDARHELWCGLVAAVEPAAVWVLRKLVR